jgi:tetratricopeptide (TPR) repeat protein
LVVSFDAKAAVPNPDETIPARRVLTAITTPEVHDLLQRHPVDAERRAREILKRNPDSTSAALLLSTSLRVQGKPQAAKALVEPVVHSMPNFAGALYELALAQADMGECAEAFAALSRAVDISPERADMWFVLAELWITLHDSGIPTSLTADTLHRGDLAAVEELARERLKTDPLDSSALDFQAQISFWHEDSTRAEQYLRLCLERASDFDAARFRLAALLFATARFAEALPHVEHLLTQWGSEVVFRTMRADCLARVQRQTEAASGYAALVAEQPERAGLWLRYGRTLRALQRLDEAAKAFEKAVTLMPLLAEGYWNLASIKSYRFRPEQVADLRARIGSGRMTPVAQAHLHFALGKALEDEQKFAGSFEHYRKFHELLRPDVDFNPAEQSAFVQQSKRLFTRELFAARSVDALDSNAAIFIVGMPRSGTTLVEQILASHSAVEGMGELSHLPDLVSRFRNRHQPYPESLDTLGAAALRAIGKEYLALAQTGRQTDRPFFTDKFPLNFNHVGLILRMLPNAKIIDVRRHPLDCGLSCFKNYFPMGVPFAHDLTHIGRYYRDYVELMAHFDTVLPGRIHRVIYEDLVANPEREVRRLLAYLGLPFEHCCLQFHAKERVVTTLSSEQVRKPMYADSIGYWRNYERWLSPLKHALGDILAAYPAVPMFSSPAPSGYSFRMSWN